MGIAQYDETAPFVATGSIDNGDGTSYVYISDAQLVNVRLDGVVCLNSDTVDHVVNLAMTSTGGSVELGGVNVPAGSGLGGLAVVDLVPELAPAAIGGFLVPAGYRMQALCAVAVTAGKLVTVNCLGGYI